jgi:hypothetical protein
MEAEMRSLGIDPEAAMQRVAEVVGGRNRKGGRNVSKHAELNDYFKTPRLQELFEFSEGRVHGAKGHDQVLKKIKSDEDILNDGPEKREARRLVAKSANKQHNRTDHHPFDVSVMHQACNYVQDTATLQRDLRCAFERPHKRVKEVMILRCVANTAVLYSICICYHKFNLCCQL